MQENMDQDIYRKLQRHIDKMPIGFPETKSGVELDLLKYLFTPREAEIALHLNFAWFRDLESLNVIYSRMEKSNLSLNELEKELDDMVMKGLILFRRDKNQKYYGNSLFMVGLYENQVNKLNKNFLKNTFKYLKEGLGLEVFGTKISQFRIVPVERSISPEHHIPTYDELIKIIENIDGPFAVQNCICRQATDLLGHPCKKTDRREVCLGFGPFAEHYITAGFGREITKNEALDILRQNEEDGLILQVGNALNPHFICSCCGCCCPVIRGTRSFPRPIQFFHSNYYAEVDKALCSGCGTCIDRCQMNAIKLINQISKINLKKCIGCGNCVTSCPEEAIHLYKKETEINPPTTMDDLYQRIQAKKSQLKKNN